MEKSIKAQENKKLKLIFSFIIKQKFIEHLMLVTS